MPRRKKKPSREKKSSSTFFTDDARTDEEKAQDLLALVLKGKEREALEMIAADPALLLLKASAQDYSGRTIEATAFQAAVGAHDTRMAKKILPYFDKIEGLPEGEASRQFDAQFPDGVEADFSKGKENTYNFTQFIESLIEKPNVDADLEAFRKAMTSDNPIKSGSHFNMQHLIAALKGYIDKKSLSQATVWKSESLYHKKILFWNKVIGFVQRQMPTHYAQAHCSGLLTAYEYEGLYFKRQLLFYDTSTYLTKVDGFYSGISLPSIHHQSRKLELGFDYGCISRHSGAEETNRTSDFELPGIHVIESMADTLEKYVARTQTELQELKNLCEKAPTPPREPRTFMCFKC